MGWFDFLSKKPSSRAVPRTPRRTILTVEVLEDRTNPSTVDLVAYRPVTPHIDYAQYRVLEDQELSYTEGAGIRINGDDDNGNGVPDYADQGPTAAPDDDLIRVDVSDPGTITYTNNLQLWTTPTKTQAVASGSAVESGTYWVEYVSPMPTTEIAPATITLSSGDASDQLVLHSFQSVVIAIGGRTQNPADVGDPRLGAFTIGLTLYQQGYDVHLFAHEDINFFGAGAAYDETVSAIEHRGVSQVAIVGYSYGGGAAFQLARRLAHTAAIQGDYTLAYTTSIDGVHHMRLRPQRRLPPATQYADNIYQRSGQTFLHGARVPGANNLNVTDTPWGRGLDHYTIDDDAMVQAIVIENLKKRVPR